MGVTKGGYRMKLPESKQPRVTPSPQKEHSYKLFCGFNNLISKLELHRTLKDMSAPSLGHLLGSTYLY